MHVISARRRGAAEWNLAIDALGSSAKNSTKDAA
jgi:hypothetical protein